MKYEFTILVPLYNEEPNLLRVEQELDLYIKKAPVKTCVLFINDGSTDNSLQLVQEISRRNEAFKFISFDRNYGLSSAIKAGFDHADTPLIGYIDSDLQTDPDDFNLLLKHIGEYDLVTGMRTNRKDSVKKNLSSLIANGIRRSFTQDGMDDTGCPLKVIKADYAKRIPMFKGLHRFLPAMVLLQNGKVKQVPVRHYARIAGKAKFHLLNRLAGPLVDCFAFLWMKRSYINYKVAEKNE
ncbi:glycosyltransferase [Salinimicrobium sp. TIG7-5_MAKvit]|uniref:glycosyltransferase n=1 Tax=Salinimicrobium sp. TIG7-5_MAKvit TaxID=3121289 RepID=UPI003C6E6EB5